jgi:hypothetical protein
MDRAIGSSGIWLIVPLPKADEYSSIGFWQVVGARLMPWHMNFFVGFIAQSSRWDSLPWSDPEFSPCHENSSIQLEWVLIRAIPPSEIQKQEPEQKFKGLCTVDRLSDGKLIRLGTTAIWRLARTETKRSGVRRSLSARTDDCKAERAKLSNDRKDGHFRERTNWKIVHRKWNPLKSNKLK